MVSICFLSWTFRATQSRPHPRGPMFRTQTQNACGVNRKRALSQYLQVVVSQVKDCAPVSHSPIYRDLSVRKHKGPLRWGRSHVGAPIFPGRGALSCRKKQKYPKALLPRMTAPRHHQLRTTRRCNEATVVRGRAPKTFKGHPAQKTRRGLAPNPPPA